MLGMMKCSRYEPLTMHGDGRRQRGFTFIEMLVVIAMLSIILAMGVLPNLRRSMKRAEMLSQVKMIQQAVGVSRIHAIKNSTRVGLQLLPYEAKLSDSTAATDQEVFSWVDANANDAFDAGEDEVGRWPLETKTAVSIDESDVNRALHQLAGSAYGVVFLPNGTSIAHENQIGTGQGSMVIQDLQGNRLRVTVMGGAGSVLVHMWDHENSVYSDKLKFWRY